MYFFLTLSKFQKIAILFLCDCFNNYYIIIIISPACRLVGKLTQKRLNILMSCNANSSESTLVLEKVSFGKNVSPS